MPAAVGAVLAGWPDDLRDRLIGIRALIFETAAAEGAGPLGETLKWGQPAYRPERGHAGTTVRLGHAKGAPEVAAVFVPCRTVLVDTFRAEVPGLAYQGDRAILLPLADPLPDAALRRCLALALTYRRRR